MAALTVPASALTEGAWRSTWGAWEIALRGTRGRWEVRISSCVKGQSRVQIAKRNVFSTSAEAVSWACQTLSAHGAVCFIDGRPRSLESFLAFERTLCAVPA